MRVASLLFSVEFKVMFTKKAEKAKFPASKTYSLFNTMDN